MNEENSAVINFTRDIDAALLDQLASAKIVTSTMDVSIGPQVATWKVHLIADQVAGLKRLAKLRDALAHVLGVEGVRIDQRAGHVRVEVPLPKSICTTPNAARKLCSFAEKDSIPIGLDNDAQPVLYQPALHGAIGWIGPSRRGKTQAMKSFLYMVKKSNPAACFYVFGIPAKLQNDWASFENALGCMGLIGDYDEMVQLIKELETLCTNRPRKENPLYIILDDLTALPAKEFGEALGKIAVTGAGLGYHLMIGTHGGGSKQATGDSMVENTMTARVLYKPASRSTGARASGFSNDTTGVDQLSSNPGDAMYMEHGHTVRVSTPYISDSSIMTLPQKKSAQVVTHMPIPAVAQDSVAIPAHWPITPGTITDSDKTAIRNLYAAGYSASALANGILFRAKNRARIALINQIVGGIK